MKEKTDEKLNWVKAGETTEQKHTLSGEKRLEKDQEKKKEKKSRQRRTAP